MSRKLIIALAISLVAIAAFMAGCTNPGNPVVTATPTAAPEPTAIPVNTSTSSTFFEANNGQGVQVTPGSIFTVRLNENPTTGYSWNWTLTPGLVLINTSFVSNDSGISGAGGVRTWELKTTTNATQAFTAVYKRSWEPVFGNETTYSLNVTSAGATSMTTYTEANDNQTVTVSKGAIIAIMLNENPSTGYQWNTSSTSGLTIKDVGYVQGGAPGMVGAGGNHTWEVTATGEGNQTFSGIYKQSWMPTAGNEKTYTLKVNIV